MTNKINSRNKGNRFERDIAKWFERWSGYEFGRVPGSGSLRWKKTDNITGDITCTDDKHARRFPFSVECKFYQDLRFDHVLLGNKSAKIATFWEQCEKDSIRANKIPILFMRYNQMPKDQYFIVINEDFFKRLSKFISSEANTMAINFNSKKLVVVMATDLIQIEYKECYKIARSITKKI